MADISQLIELCKNGESSARDQLFDHYRPYLRMLAEMQLGKQLRARCEASDIVQQTLLEAHRDFDGFAGRHEGELIAWLRRILAHNLFNEARYHGAQQRAVNREVSFERCHAGVEQSSLALGACLAANQATPSSIAARHEAAIGLAALLAQLPADYQQVLLLRIFEGLSAEEVAERMERTAGAVRMLQLRALTALRDLMNSPSVV